MSLPNYNPEGKKLTYFQHMEKIRKQKELDQQKLEQNKGEVPGRCSVCDSTKFSLKCGEVGKGIIIRTCSNEKCGDVKEF
jgi:hypothetical protein